MITDTCQPSPAPLKPSDRIEAMMQADLHRSIKAIFAAVGTPLSDTEIATFREGPGGADPTLQIAGLSCYVAAIKAELDREAERRAKWETDATELHRELLLFKNRAVGQFPQLLDGDPFAGAADTVHVFFR